MSIVVANFGGEIYRGRGLRRIEEWLEKTNSDKEWPTTYKVDAEDGRCWARLTRSDGGSGAA